MTSYKAEVTLNEKDTMQDMLNLEKTLVKVYATSLTEGTSKGFRQTIDKFVSETAEDQINIFLQMTDKGYVKVQSAEQTMLSQEKNKFSKVKGQLA